jgi:uncharacterized protein YqhQ
VSGANGASSNGAGGPQAEGRLRLGGMALRNGLLIHGPTSWAVAARAGDGRIEVASGPKPSFTPPALASTPLIRGPLRLAEALAIVPLARLRLSAARLPFEDRTVVAAVLASAVGSRILRRASRASLGREAAIAVLGALPAFAALRDSDLAEYHAVEHKSIGGYETDTDPADVPKEHERCGSNLIAPMLALSITGQVAVERLLSRPGPLARALAAVGAVGIAVELFAYAERHPDSALGRAIHGPGYEIQRLVSTREPSADQLEVGVVALNEILRLEHAAADTV